MLCQQVSNYSLSTLSVFWKQNVNCKDEMSTLQTRARMTPVESDIGIFSCPVKMYMLNTNGQLSANVDTSPIEKEGNVTNASLSCPLPAILACHPYQTQYSTMLLESDPPCVFHNCIEGFPGSQGPAVYVLGLIIVLAI